VAALFEEFERVGAERSPAGSRSNPAPATRAARRRLELVEFGEPAAPDVADSAAPVSPETPTHDRPLTFDETELARACAAAAAAAAHAAEAAAAERWAASDHLLREKLAAAVEALRAEIGRRDEALRMAVGRLVGVALEALLPVLRSARAAAALERVLAAAIGERRSLPTLTLELPERDAPALAARVPTLLAEAGFEGGVEIRPIAEGEVFRLVCGDLWAELDAAAWAGEVCERVRAAIESLDFVPSGEVEEADG
jgi:hypothetical protein